MNTELYTTAYNDGAVRIDAYDDASFDAAAIAPVLAPLQPAVSPTGADAVIYYDKPNCWGRVALAKAGVFAKGIFTYRFMDRVAPFLGIDRLIVNWERAASANLPIPAYRGAFAVRQHAEWLWGGILSEYLDGWRELDKTSAADADLMLQAIAAFAKQGVYNRDMHCKNAMTDGNGGIKIVDLDALEFGWKPAEAKAAMEAYFAASLEE